jgi:hypothetical protein
MCASYIALPSASVSTRMIVPPGTFAFAMSVTLVSASPVSSVSSARWPPQGRCALGADDVGADGGVVVLEPDPLAAVATP